MHPFRFVSITLPLAAVCVSAPSLSAQHFQTQVIARGLSSPAGILLAPNGAIYFTELPTPGVKGGSNTVSVLTNGAVNTLVTGEPEPTNLAMDGNGNLYWTCRSAGVIQELTNGSHAPIATNLTKPVGLAASAGGQIFFTQVPTPGVPGSQGGTNSVAQLVNGAAQVLSMGEPEPTDVAVDADGNLFWTCRTAGVIVRLDGTTGVKSKLLDDLDHPVGLTVDASGRLYFTEVPTPGVSGPKGGRNSVWRFDPTTRNFALVDFGDPYPQDITVAPDGSSVYWTCRSAGVIVQADLTGTFPTVTSSSRTQIGDTVLMQLDAPTQGGHLYQAATSGGRGPLLVDQRALALDPDGLFVATVLNMAPGVAGNYGGVLDASGRGAATLTLPNLPALQGLALNTAFFTLDPMAPSSIGAISGTYQFVIQ